MPLQARKISPTNGDGFRLVLENNPHPMWIFDHQTLQFLEVNPAAISKYGYTREEFLKMKITEIRPKKDVPLVLSEHKRFQMDRTHFGEWRHLLKDQRLIDVEITAYPLYFAGRAAVLVQAQDITERKKAQEALRKLAVLEERNRIAREIHDTLAQAFIAIVVQLEAAIDVLPKQARLVNEHITQARNLAKESLAEARRSIWKLHPRESEKKSLPAAIKRLTRLALREGISTRYSVRGKPRILSGDIQDNLLRICQEALTNVIRHAGATRIHLILNFHTNRMQLILQDDGKGFNPTDAHSGFGLIGMQERANRIGATLTLSSTPGKGTRVTVEVQS